MAGTLGPVDLLEPTDLKSSLDQIANVQGQALNDFANRGLTLPPVPVNVWQPGNRFNGDLPANMTALDDNQLGDLLNMMGQYCAFVDVEYAKISASRNEAKLALRRTEARVRMALKKQHPGRSLTVDDRKDIMDVDPLVEKAQFDLLYWESLYELVRVTRDKAIKNWETVSRRITQRGQEIDRMRRETSVAGIPAQFGQRFASR